MRQILFFIVVCITLVSCTKAKTDYEAELNTVVTEHDVFKEAATATAGAYRVSIEALNGTFYKGYNEIRLRITDNQENGKINVSAATFLPVLASEDGNTSGPHRYDLLNEPTEGYLSGYVVLTCASSTDANWTFYIGFTVNNQNFTIQKTVNVQEQTNKNLNMTSFTGSNGEQYFIALVAPQKPKVAENELVAGIYKFNKPTEDPVKDFPDPRQFSYSTVAGYSLLLDPRMPEASMGNHSSPNNKDLTQQADGLYHGIVNYTMTGNWTLNLMLLDENGTVLKGTAVPVDRTPGVEGAKSELYIDILF